MATGLRQDSIQAEIDRLKQDRDIALSGVKRQLRQTGQSLRPAHLIRDAAKDVIESNDLRQLALKAAGTWVMALILKKAIQKGEAYIGAKEVKEDNNPEPNSFWDRALESLVAHGAEFVEEQLHHFMAKHEQTSGSDVHTSKAEE